MPRTIFENIVIQHYAKSSSFEYCQYTTIRFFEILLIEEGSGSLTINGHRVPYAGNQLFIFVPNDMYTFYVDTPTSLSTIKFLNNLFIQPTVGSDRAEVNEWFKKIEIILHSTARTSNIEFRSPTEQNTLLSLFNVICKEYNDSDLQSELIIKNTLHSILHIIARNAGHSSSVEASSQIQEMVNYIHYHIYDAERISNKTIAGEFHIAENYIGQYFKKQMGISLKKYILSHKVKLAETRLKYTDLTLSEIAAELGFTDSSHLDKTFVSYKGIAAGAYRAQQKRVQ
ncbi:AraC family transcriptional regulator [Mangrovibacterium sp.]|uniref:AraC family transcriptional regulator n=1 Tax=Mangrovibacterium sp. TaxID=1961364 RepID=UPI00356968DB